MGVPIRSGGEAGALQGLYWRRGYVSIHSVKVDRDT